MPYANPEKQREAKAKWARENYERQKTEREILIKNIRTIMAENTELQQKIDEPRYLMDGGKLAHLMLKERLLVEKEFFIHMLSILDKEAKKEGVKVAGN